jgi:hypothetical protein
LGLIANELDVCIPELRERRRRILEVRQECFSSDQAFEEISDSGLKSLASELGGLEHGIGRYRKEASPYFDLDAE